MPILTVFTPAYNRAHTLPRTYESLRNQTCKEFVWLIVDDGSKDDTKQLVEEWQQQETAFEIRYVYKQNGGMHTAHNTAYEVMDTELNVCIDSDDKMPPDAVEIILREWEKVRDKGVAGMIGLDATFDGQILGKGFPNELKETTLCGYYAAGGTGDKKLVYRTDVIKQYPPYPVFDGEKYVALAYKYRLIDQEYTLAVVNEILCNVEYQPDGSSNTMWKQYMNNPKGFAFWRKVCMQYPESAKRVWIDAAHYVANSRLAGEKEIIKKSPKRVQTVIMYPVGLLLTWYIKRCNKMR